HKRRASQPERRHDIGRMREEPTVEVEDMRGLLDETQVPVCLQRPELWPPKKAQRTRLVVPCPLEDLGEGGMVRRGIAIRPPLVHALPQDLMEMAHLPGILHYSPLTLHEPVEIRCVDGMVEIGERAL